MFLIKKVRFLLMREWHESEILQIDFLFVLLCLKIDTVLQDMNDVKVNMKLSLDILPLQAFFMQVKSWAFLIFWCLVYSQKTYSSTIFRVRIGMIVFWNLSTVSNSNFCYSHWVIICEWTATTREINSNPISIKSKRKRFRLNKQHLNMVFLCERVYKCNESFWKGKDCAQETITIN